MLGKVDVFPLEDFSGGLKTRGGIYAREKQAATSPNCNAVISSTGRTLQKMRGYTKLSDQKTGTGYGIFNYAKDTATNFLIAHIGTVLYKMDAFDGVLDSIRTGVGEGYSDFDTFTKADGTQILLTLNQANDKMHSWDGTGATTTEVSTAPQGKYLKVWKNRVWVVGHASYPSRLQWSNLQLHTTWTATDIDENFATPQGDAITGLAVLRDRLIVFKKQNIFACSYLGGSPLFDVKKVIADCGTDANHTIKNATILSPNANGGFESTEVLIFLSSDRRLMAFDGSSVMPISEAITDTNGVSPISMDTLSTQYLYTAHAFMNHQTHRYSLYVANAAATLPNYALHYDTYTSGIWPESGQTFECSGMVMNSINQSVPVGITGGYVYLLDSGSTYDGTTISDYYETDIIDMAKSAVIQKGGRFEIHAKLVGGTNSIGVQHRNDGDGSFSTVKTLSFEGGDRLGSTFVLGTSVLGGPRAATGIYNFPYMVNGTQLRVSGISTIYKIDYLAEGKGYGKSQ
jgi:hypothetical protein